MLDSGNESAACVLLVLAWISSSGGSLLESDIARLSEIAASSDCDVDIQYLFGLAHRRDIKSITLACEVVQRTYRGEQADQLMSLAISSAIADGKLQTGRSYVLRLVADLLGVDKAHLNSLFANITGKPIPAPPRLHSAEYWQERENQGSTGNYSHRNTSHSEPDDGLMFPYDELGLPETATVAEIRAAYRKLAQQHHPDRVASQGPEAVAEATLKFQRIQESYEYLMKHA